MTEKNGLNPSIPSATEVKPDKSFLRRYGTLLGFLLILGILYLWFLHPWFPVYETLPERPPAPPRQENAFYPFLDAASVISASTTDVRAVVSFTHDFAGGLVCSATIPEYIEGLQEENSEALRLYREGT